jgi:hypothetical protein
MKRSDTTERVNESQGAISKVRLVDSIFRVVYLLGLTATWIVCAGWLGQDWAAGSEHALATALLIVGFMGIPVALMLECRRWARGEPFLSL